MQIYKYRFLKRIIAFVKDKHWGTFNYCALRRPPLERLPERALSNELMRRHSFKL